MMGPTRNTAINSEHIDFLSKIIILKITYPGGDYKKRKIITKFRISAHDLEIERGRYRGLKADRRTCNLCQSVVEDEVHFLMECPNFKPVRKPILESISSKYVNFQKLDTQQKFIWIMSSEDHFIYEHLYSLLSTLNIHRAGILGR